MAEWKVTEHGDWEKKFQLYSRDATIELWVDYDDVWHDKVDAEAEKIAKILSDHWDDPKYALPPMEQRFEEDDGS